MSAAATGEMPPVRVQVIGLPVSNAEHCHICDQWTATFGGQNVGLAGATNDAGMLRLLGTNSVIEKVFDEIGWVDTTCTGCELRGRK